MINRFIEIIKRECGGSVQSWYAKIRGARKIALKDALLLQERLGLPIDFWGDQEKVLDWYRERSQDIVQKQRSSVVRTEVKKTEFDISIEESFEVFDKARWIVCSCPRIGAGTFSVPLNFVRDGNVLYIQGDRTGTKAELFKDTNEVEVVVVGEYGEFELNKDEIASFDKSNFVSGIFATNYTSVIARTRVFSIRNEAEKKATLRKLCEKYRPNALEKFEEIVEFEMLKKTYVYELKIDQISGRRVKIK